MDTEDIDYKAIGERVRTFRKAKGLTQQQLCELTRMEPSNISHIERGATKLSLPSLVNIANALDVTADDILCDSVKSSRASYESNISAILKESDHDDLIIIEATLKSLQKSLKQMKK